MKILNKSVLQNKQKFKNTWIEAVYTIEAVFILPLLFFILLLLIYFNFYLHDRVCTIAQVHSMSLLYEEKQEVGIIERLLGKQEEINLKKEKQLKEKLNDVLWMSNYKEVVLEQGRLKQKIIVKLLLNLPEEGITEITPNIAYEFQINTKKTTIKRAEQARILSIGIESIDKIKGISTVLEKIRTFLKKESS